MENIKIIQVCKYCGSETPGGWCCKNCFDQFEEEDSYNSEEEDD